MKGCLFGPSVQPGIKKGSSAWKSSNHKRVIFYRDPSKNPSLRVSKGSGSVLFSMTDQQEANKPQHKSIGLSYLKINRQSDTNY